MNIAEQYKATFSTDDAPNPVNYMGALMAAAESLNKVDPAIFDRVEDGVIFNLMMDMTDASFSLSAAFGFTGGVILIPTVEAPTEQGFRRLRADTVRRHIDLLALTLRDRGFDVSMTEQTGGSYVALAWKLRNGDL